MAVQSLHVQLLGDFSIKLGDTLITSVNSPRVRSLLAFLVIHHEAPQARHRIAFAFWPDATEASAHNNLRQLLFELRHTLPQANRFLSADHAMIQWRADAQFVLDVADFRHALTEAKLAAQMNDQAQRYHWLERAVDLYHGDLFPDCYDEWIIPERERARQEFIIALEALVGLQEQRSDYRGAIANAKRLLLYDQLHESTYRGLMRLYVSNGDRASALQTFHACTTILERELAVEPNAETRTEYERLLKSDAPPTPVPTILPGIVPLVGRQREWEQLQATWRIVDKGRPHMVILQGETGIGKTRLMEEMIIWAQRQGIANASARCYAAEGAPAFAPIVTWLRALTLAPLEDVWMSEIARLVPELASAHREWRLTPIAEEWQRQRLFEAIARALPTSSQPLLLSLDDLQWCDRDTLAFLRYILRFEPRPRVMIVGTCRVEDIDPAQPLTALILTLRQSEQLTTLNLGSLDKQATLTLATKALGREIEPQQTTRLYQETEGNPLFVVEVVRAWSSGSYALPSKLQAAIDAQLAPLSLTARELADIAAIIGRDFAVDVLSQTSGMSEDVLVHGIDELWRRRIVREQDALTYDFTHEKVREAIVDAQSVLRKRMLHRRVAVALETIHASALDPVSAVIASHYEWAGNAEQAIEYYERAALVARRLFANQDALDQYRRALAMCRSTTPKETVARLNENLGDLLHWVGHYDQARVTYQKALVGIDEHIALARVHRKLGNTWRDQRGYQEALQSYADADRTLNQTLGDPSDAWWHEWIQIELEIGSVYYWLDQMEQGDWLRKKLEPAIEQYGTLTQRAAYFQHVAGIELRRNRSVATPETTALARAALAAHQEAGNQAQIPAAQFLVGFHLLWSGNPHDALEPFQTALDLAERRGDVSLQARCLTYLTIASRQCDSVIQTQSYAARSLDAAARADMPEYIGTAKANQAWVAYRAHDLARADDLGRAALEAWSKLPTGHASVPFQWVALFPLIAVELDQEQVDQAVHYAQVMTDSHYQRLPDQITATLKQAIDNWVAGSQEAAVALFSQSIVLAREFKYL